jgi:hypothetical protein
MALSPKASHDELNFARHRRHRDSLSVPLGAAIASKLRLREIYFRSNQEGTDHTVPVLHCPDDAERKVLTSDTYSRSLSTPADIAAIDSAGGKGRRRETRACHGQTHASWRGDTPYIRYVPGKGRGFRVMLCISIRINKTSTLALSLPYVEENV